ncbi:MAG: DNA-directed RNA polymerase subunit alpha [Dehalococcoidia bacterium]|nr:DNA-directed RNA polymerase subunit alpha [Dehalococcoidia bacterium]
MSELSTPSVTCLESAANYGRFLAEPLEPGFGVTLGNTLRRVLLSSLPGAAVTWVRIEGIQHEFSPLPSVKEDAMEFLLNIKQLRLCPLTREPGQLVLEAEGEGKICAADIRPSAAFRIANPELYLASLDSSDARLYVEINVELGRGYVPGRSVDGLPLGALAVDAIFTPVRKVNFSVESIRPGQEGSPEKLTLEIWTDATIFPWEALNQSAIILLNQFSAFRDLEIPMAKTLSILPEQYEAPLETLGLSTRSYNSLKRAGILTLGQLMEKGEEGLPPLPGLGAKSRAEVEELMARLGSPVAKKNE